MKNPQKYMIRIFRVYMVVFFILGLYIAYIMGVESMSLSQDPDNPRSREVLSRRGRIYTRSGKPVAGNTAIDDIAVRIFPFGPSFEPLAGYYNPRFGKGGLENNLDKYLHAPASTGSLSDYILRIKHRGENIYLTIDEDIQNEAFRALGESRGAVVVINPSNGEILALASSPSFDPATMESQWDKLRQDKDAPLLLRPVNGCYPPGSVFKLFTYAACLEEGIFTPDDIFHCSGVYSMNYELGTYRIHEAGGQAHGTLSCVDAIVHSCNIALAQMGLELGAHRFVEYGEKFGLNKRPGFILSAVDNRFPITEKLTSTILAQSAFGQGEVTLSPLQVALMVCAFANDGVIMEPELIKTRVDEDGKSLYQARPLEWKRPISSHTARKVKEAMIETVNRGTGWRASIPGIEVAGKTGSAENPAGDTHAWFACFAPAENPKAVVVVIVENGGGGGVTAAPIAKSILEKILNKNN